MKINPSSGDIKIGAFNVSDYESVKNAFYEDYMTKNNISSSNFAKKLNEFYATSEQATVCNAVLNKPFLFKYC